MKNFTPWVVLCMLMAGSLIAPAAKGQEGPGKSLTVPEGTEFKMQLRTPMDSKTSKVGDRVVGILVSPAYVGNQVAFPKGTRVEGHITAVQPARHRGRGGSVTPVFNDLELANGTKIPILGFLSEVFRGKHASEVHVDLEGDLKGQGASRLKETAVVAGAAATGGIAGLGVAIASGIGGLFGAVFVPRGHEAALDRGAVIGMRLANSTVVEVSPQPLAMR